METIVVATIGFFASVITASLSYYFAKKHQLQAEDRRLKEEYYKNFIKALSDVAIDNYDDEAQKRLSEGFNSLIVIAGAPVVKKLMDFHNFVRIENKDFSRDSKDWSLKHNELLRELIKSMREDLFGKEKNIDIFIENVHLVGRKPK